MRTLIVFAMLLCMHYESVKANLDIVFTPANPIICKGKSITIQAQLTGNQTGAFSFPYSKVNGTEIYVSPSGNDITGTGAIGNPYKTIQRGVNAASNGRIVTLLDGTYSGTGNVNVSLGGKQITVQSQNGPLQTTIDCNLNGRAFILNQGETMNTIIKGLTIMNGKTNAAPNGYGSAIFVEDNSGVAIRDCFFRNNSQGTIQFGDTEVGGPQSKVEHCAFIGNAEGCIHASKKSFMVEACLFVNNTSTGGMVGNGHVADPAQQYKNCVFVCNSGSTVAGINHGKVIFNSLFISNTTNVGVVYAGTNWSGMNTVDHCTFYNNACNYFNSNWYDHVGAVKSSIFFPGNARDHVSGKQADLPFTKCLGDNIPGNGNITGNPKFVDPAAFNFALQSTSPCIGTGENGTNMGADVSVIPQWIMDYVRTTGNLASINWEGGSTTGSATFTPTSSKYYKVTFSGCGVSYTDSVLVTVKDETITTRYDSTCSSIVWNGNVYSATGKYSVKLTGSDGCDSTAILDLFIRPKPMPTITGMQNVCLGAKNVMYSVPNVPSSTFLWKQPKNGTIVGSAQQTTASLDWSLPGIDTLFITQTNLLSGCTKDTFIVVNVLYPPIPLISGDNKPCISSKGVVYTVNPKIPGNTYIWNNPKHGIVKGGLNSSSITVDWTNEGIDTMRLRMTDNVTGCSKDTMFIVNITPLPKPIIYGSASVCEQSKGVQYEVPYKSGNTYQWSYPNLGIILGNPNSSIINIDWNNTGVDTIRVKEIHTPTGCSKDTFLIVKIQQSLSPDIIPFANEYYLCEGDSRGLECTIDADYYEWKFNGEILPELHNKIILAFKPGKYRVTAKSGQCSGESKDIEILEKPKPSPIINGPRIVEELQRAIVYQADSSLQQSTFEWSISGKGTINGGSKDKSVKIDMLDSGSVILTVTERTPFDCFEKDTFLIQVIKSAVSGVKEQAQSSLHFIPHPITAGEKAYMVGIASAKPINEIEFIDMLGRMQAVISGVPVVLDGRCEIMVPSIPQGMYMMRIRFESETLTQLIHIRN